MKYLSYNGMALNGRLTVTLNNKEEVTNYG